MRAPRQVHTPSIYYIRTVCTAGRDKARRTEEGDDKNKKEEENVDH